jgi:hypothetical protein
MTFHRRTGYVRTTLTLIALIFGGLVLLIAPGVIAALASAQSETVPVELIEPVEPQATAEPVAEPTVSAEPTRGRVQVQERRAPRPEAARPPVRDLPETAVKPRTIRLAPVTALADQGVVDTGKLVTWMTSPVCLLAGHNTMGWAWMDDLATGTRVRVVAGPCAGLYEVYGHRSQSRKGGPVPAWMSAPELDLVLQTCKTRGMGFSLLRRV